MEGGAEDDAKQLGKVNAKTKTELARRCKYTLG